MMKHTVPRIFKNVELEYSIPTRTRLSFVHPLAIGSLWVEGLSGLISRIAEIHSIPTSFLVFKEIGALSKNFWIQGRGLDMFHARIMASGDASEEVAAIVERLTGSVGVRYSTMSFCSDAISKVDLIKSFRAWCSQCYQEWSDSGSTIYDPLIWAIDAVRFCPRHQKELTNKCPQCDSKLLHLDVLSRPGYCSRCSEWLGRYAESNAQDISVSTDLEWQTSVTSNIGEMIAAAHSRQETISKDKLIASIRSVFAAAEGKEFPDSPDLNRRIIFNWLNGITAPRLKSLLQFCSAFRVPLCDLVFGVQQKVPIKNRRKDYGRIEKMLKRSMDEYPPRSLRSVCSDLDVATRTVRRQFPDLVKKIVLNYRRFGKRLWGPKIRSGVSGTKKTPDFLAEAKNYLEQLINECPPPPLQRAYNYLGAGPKCLRRHFPELCRKINLNFQAFYRGRSIQESFYDHTKSYLEKALGEMCPPSFSQVLRVLRSSESALLRRFPALVSALKAKSKEYRKRNMELLERELEEALTISPPPALWAISKRLGVYVTTLENRFPSLSRAVIERRKKFFSSRLVSANELRKALQEYPPPSLSEIANRYNCRPECLRYWFPSIVKRIASNHQQYRKSRAVQLKSQFREELTKVVMAIIAEGNFPTNRAVYSRMKGVKCKVAICAQLRSILNALGEHSADTES